MKNNIRAFIALELTKEFKKELSEIQAKLKKVDSDIAWVNPGNLHLSLIFLGDINLDLVPKVETIIENVGRQIEIFSLALDVLGVFPNINSPRVVWAGIGSGYNAVTQLNTLLCQELKAGKLDVQKKHFHPHITLGRIKEIRDMSLFSEMIDSLKPHCRKIDIKNIALFESKLSSKGPIYTKISELKSGKS